jgi:predicted lysophospholipase L1 biosynthesis ABC-type transport system permease subunit
MQDIARGENVVEFPFTFTAEEVRADTPAGDVALDVPWTPVADLGFDGEISGGATPLSATVRANQQLPGTIRFMADGSADPIATSVSRLLAARSNVADGDTIRLEFAGIGRTVDASVDDIVPVVAGETGDYAALVDLGDLGMQQLRTATTIPDATERWLTTTDVSATAAAVRDAVGPDPRITTTSPEAENTLLGSARVALWWGAIGALLLAVVSVSAVAGALLRSRAPEVTILRAVGMSARQQAAGRRRELGLLLGFSLIAGVVGGVVVSLLTVGGLARSTVLDPIAALPTPVSIDALAFGASILAFLLALVAVIGVYSARVARQARTLSAREEVR